MLRHFAAATLLTASVGAHATASAYAYFTDILVVSQDNTPFDSLPGGFETLDGSTATSWISIVGQPSSGIPYAVSASGPFLQSLARHGGFPGGYANGEVQQDQVAAFGQAWDGSFSATTGSSTTWMEWTVMPYTTVTLVGNLSLSVEATSADSSASSSMLVLGGIDDTAPLTFARSLSASHDAASLEEWVNFSFTNDTGLPQQARLGFEVSVTGSTLPVPEPSTWMLALIGVATVAATQLRRTSTR